MEIDITDRCGCENQMKPCRWHATDCTASASCGLAGTLPLRSAASPVLRTPHLRWSWSGGGPPGKVNEQVWKVSFSSLARKGASEVLDPVMLAFAKPGVCDPCNGEAQGAGLLGHGRAGAWTATVGEPSPLRTPRRASAPALSPVPHRPRAGPRWKNTARSRRLLPGSRLTF